MKLPKTELDDASIAEICEALKQNLPVRRKLPGGGHLQIDRNLPFLFVYRQPPNREDLATERLIRAEAAFLIVPGAKSHRAWVSSLVESLAELHSKEFGAFLILEILAMAEAGAEFDADWHPYFRVLVPKSGGPPPQAVDALEQSLRKVKVFKKSSHVDVLPYARGAFHGLPAILSERRAKELDCSTLVLEVRPIYRDSESGVFPLAFRTLRRQLSFALKRSVHQFCLGRTTHAPASYLANGRRGLGKSIVDVDRRLAQISESFDFLLQITPVNVDAAWREFKRSHYERAPVFAYRPVPVDPAILKRRLFGIPVEQIADPPIEQLFRDKQLEMDRKLTMFLDRGTNAFLYGSLQLFGPVSPELLSLAEEILKRVPTQRAKEPKAAALNAEAFAEIARAEIDYYTQKDSTFSATVEVRPDVLSVMVSNGNLLVGNRSQVPAARVQAVLQHEVGTHIVTYFNGCAQPLRILSNGLASYDELQEGLAVLSEYLVGGLSRSRLRTLAGRVVATHSLVSGASFVETFRLLTQVHRFGLERAFNLTARIYRSGGLTKDAAYLRGLVEVLDYLGKGRSMEALLVGKIASPYLSVMHELKARRVITAPRILPRYLDLPEPRRRLEELRSGISVLELAKRL